ncbi:helix-turn-helix transcriptional regulator [Streptomyces sp. DSM 44917]|uniref:Helix-turn-helix transcriptional regulator n=1 Tax=Streptomyces boetiae TaxID=3075541 RepID=A0ABU2LDK5_9ACTN|nr:helix-turn-helix transcriptional regulator [Streptomyces sp. DSM 44917]MDT0309661.1 helix-turn-helix transcriptional regulator [Streptomyces sp. DSM 44917]
MKHDAGQRFGEYITHLRREKNLSTRRLASLAGIDDGALTRLECGKVRTPRPTTVKALATALDVPLADMFARAGYVIPYDLPDVSTYLRVRYGHLPDEALSSLDTYLRDLIDKHGLDPDGPLSREDEREDFPTQ